jgi:uncharacterized protein YkwD
MHMNYWLVFLVYWTPIKKTASKIKGDPNMKSSFLLRYVFTSLLLALIYLIGYPSAVSSQSGHKTYFPFTSRPAAAAPPSGPGTCLTAEENSLARLINDYRKSVGLPPAPISKSLTMVAQYHVQDLQSNYPNQGSYGKDSRGIACNMHTWSAKGTWNPVCYTPDHKYAEGMWLKPKEITRGAYSDYGYEISAAYWGKNITAQDALNMWKSSAGHNSVIVEQGGWSGRKWPAMGIGISQTYAVVWFSSTSDPQGSVSTCR